jgi:hypothetical protein
MKKEIVESLEGEEIVESLEDSDDQTKRFDVRYCGLHTVRREEMRRGFGEKRIYAF